jgi:hypothetical protein
MKSERIHTLVNLAIALVFCLPFRVSGGNEPGTVEYVISRTLVIPGIVVSEGADGMGPVVVTIPLKRVGHLFMIEAMIDGETGNFLFDTGSQRLVLNSIYFRKYVISDEGAGGGVTGTLGKVNRTTVRRLDISGILNSNVSADVTDLGHLENRRGVKIFGLFGFCMMKNLEVVIDAGHNQLKIYRLDKVGKRLSTSDGDFQYDLSQKAEVYKDILFLQATVGSKVLNFCFDTGAESNVLSNWLPKKVMDKVTIERRSSLRGVGSANADVLYGKLNDFVIGNRQVGGMQVVLTSLESMAASYDHSVDGMLGFDFLQQGVISVNLVTKEVKLAFAKTDNP